MFCRKKKSENATVTLHRRIVLGNCIPFTASQKTTKTDATHKKKESNPKYTWSGTRSQNWPFSFATRSNGLITLLIESSTVFFDRRPTFSEFMVGSRAWRRRSTTTWNSTFSVFELLEPPEIRLASVRSWIPCPISILGEESDRLMLSFEFNSGGFEISRKKKNGIWEIWEIQELWIERGNADKITLSNWISEEMSMN